ncbi:CAP domain-containing protein [Sphaerospermopsis sp. FACHB-1094]|uniref:CAP domain-containing protein n=1 Tax=Sphaerospermopsis sp. FACHB-1094 TaxID=2692861 RepID=UPI001684D0DC|nr:CAP domain-containing protein [Sphaerospermopsis sp. FACHB-1094]MBD2133283.1 CAP domain-containing protein [Sphaerospermopsis sp. FACHB-1094]
MNSKKKIKKFNLWWRYSLLFMVLWVTPPTMHFISQALRGYPLDINYFWSELSLFQISNLGFYNGSGGSDGKIGQAQVNIWNAEQLRTVTELRNFALNLVNRDRKLNNLPPLVVDNVLSQAAQIHAEDMGEKRYFDHISSDGNSPYDRYVAVGGNSNLGLGENIYQSSGTGLGLTYGEVEKFQRGWMYSNGHRKNILLLEYKKFGYGIAMGKDGSIYAVQMFSN